MSDSHPNRSAFIAVGAVCAIALTRAQVGFDPFPRWSGDPTLQDAPLLSLTPFAAMSLDVLLILASALTLKLSKVGASALSVALLLVGGFAATLVHRDFDDLVIASGWVGAITAGFALFHACTSPRLRAFTLACLFGGVAAVFLKSLSQHFIEHPASVKMFLADKQAVFDAQGWSADSSMARSYERRILQSEASGWFGISNILATFAACASVYFAATLANAVKHRANRIELLSIALSFACSFTTLILTKSKGGFVAFAIGTATCSLLSFVSEHRIRRITRFVLPTVALLSLGAILARWLIGERIGELSLLFRGFYIEAATRIFLEHPFGVGPGGFKDAYMLLKNPLSPEDVASPHSIFFDWHAALGILGVAWVTLVAQWITAPREPQQSVEHDHAPSVRSVFLVIAIPALIGAMIERSGATPEAFVVRLGSIFLGAAIAHAVLRSAHRLGSIAALGASAVLIAHAQIELTPTANNSAPWFFALVGALCAPASTRFKPARLSPHSVALLCLPILVSLSSVLSWELSLRRAWLSVYELPELHARRNALATSERSEVGQLASSLYRDLEAKLGFEPRATDNLGRAIDEDLKSIRYQSLKSATGFLDAAHRAQPSHFETLRALSRVSLEAEMTGTALPASAGYAKELATFAQHTGRATAWAWLAIVRETSGATPGDIAFAWHSASLRAPHDPLFAFKRAVSAKNANNPAAPELAREALKIDAQQRLDPLRRLPETDIATLRSIADP